MTFTSLHFWTCFKFNYLLDLLEPLQWTWTFWSLSILKGIQKRALSLAHVLNVNWRYKKRQYNITHTRAQNANARNRLPVYYPYWQYTDNYIFRIYINTMIAFVRFVLTGNLISNYIIINIQWEEYWLTSGPLVNWL